MIWRTRRPGCCAKSHDHLTADAIGKPGQRVFYLQAYQEQRTITVIIEKAQLHSLAIGVEQFLAQLDEQNPDLTSASGDYVEEVMRIAGTTEVAIQLGSRETVSGNGQ